jgi:hypothetical protein
MPSDEAKVLAAALLANYPGSYVTQMNVLAVADTLDYCGIDIAAEVVGRARFEFKKPPSTGQIHELSREIRGERVAENLPSLALAAGEFVEQMPDDVRERVREMVAGWADEEERDHDAENAEWERKKAAALFGPRMHGVCDGAGKAPVVIDGKRVCPDCRVEVPDLVVRMPRRETA